MACRTLRSPSAASTPVQEVPLVSILDCHCGGPGILGPFSAPQDIVANQRFDLSMAAE
jgi:hypothetical protein